MASNAIASPQACSTRSLHGWSRKTATRIIQAVGDGGVSLFDFSPLGLMTHVTASAVGYTSNCPFGPTDDDDDDVDVLKRIFSAVLHDGRT